MHLRNYGMNDHIPKPWSWKRLHPCCHVSAKGQKSYSVTCTFLSAIQQMWWRQSLFQEPSIHAYLLLFTSVPCKMPCFGHLFHSFYDLECPSFTPTAILIFSLTISNQPSRFRTNTTFSMNPQLEYKASSFMLPDKFLLH